MAQVKFFYPDAAWTWYGVEFDGDDLLFGLVDGFEKELGYFRLSELLENRGKLGLPIERDFYFVGPAKPLEPAWMLAFRGESQCRFLLNSIPIGFDFWGIRGWRRQIFSAAASTR